MRNDYSILVPSFRGIQLIRYVNAPLLVYKVNRHFAVESICTIIIVVDVHHYICPSPRALTCH